MRRLVIRIYTVCKSIVFGLQDGKGKILLRTLDFSKTNQIRNISCNAKEYLYSPEMAKLTKIHVTIPTVSSI